MKCFYRILRYVHKINGLNQLENVEYSKSGLFLFQGWFTKKCLLCVFFFFKFHLLVPVTLKNSLIFRKHYNNFIKY